MTALLDTGVCSPIRKTDLDIVRTISLFMGLVMLVVDLLCVITLLDIVRLSGALVFGGAGFVAFGVVLLLIDGDGFEPVSSTGDMLVSFCSTGDMLVPVSSGCS
jgi:hypothetical protein